MYTPVKAIPIPITSSNTYSLGSSDFVSLVNFLYALGPIIKVKKARNDAVSTLCSYKAINKTNKIPIKLLNELLVTMKKGSLCALCGAIPSPIQNILKYFTHEFKTDINQEA